MNISEMIARMGGLRSMASQLGVSEQEAATGTEALAPAIFGGLERQAAPAGAGGLNELLAKLGGGNLLDSVQSPQPIDVNRGNGVLASIFGSKDVSRAVAQDASAKSGINSATLKKMLPIVAMMVAGYMAKRNGTANDRRGGRRGNALEGILQQMGQR